MVGCPHCGSVNVQAKRRPDISFATIATTSSPRVPHGNGTQSYSRSQVATGDLSHVSQQEEQPSCGCTAVASENTSDLDLQFLLPPIIQEQSFRAALAFIVARAQADRIDVTPVILGLRVHVRIAINFRRRGLQDFCLAASRGPVC